MPGDDRVRHCPECARSVFNLSGMTRAAAEELVLGAEGRVCIRFYRRPDGTVMTADCPVGQRRAWRRWLAVGAAAAILIVLAVVGRTATRSGGRVGLRDHLGPAQDVEPIRTVVDWIDPPQVYAVGEWCPPAGPVNNPPANP
jgi:hypothetical protein